MSSHIPLVLMSNMFFIRAALCDPRAAAIRDLGIPPTFYEILVLGSSMKLPGDDGIAFFIVNITRRFPSILILGFMHRYSLSVRQMPFHGQDP
jgi:hypothetical protein